MLHHCKITNLVGDTDLNEMKSEFYSLLSKTIFFRGVINMRKSKLY